MTTNTGQTSQLEWLDIQRSLVLLRPTTPHLPEAHPMRLSCDRDLSLEHGRPQTLVQIIFGV